MISITLQSTFRIWSIVCTLVLLTTKSFKNQLSSKHICSQIRIRSIRIKMISISLIVNIVEKSTQIVEMNFAMKIKQMLNFDFFDQKFALYVKNSIADQAIIRKRSEMTRKSDFRIVILNTKFVQSTIVVWNNILLILKTSSSAIQMTKMRLSISTISALSLTISALSHQWSTTLS